MEKLAVQVSGDRSFFHEVVSEAARLDRSPSWLLGHCLGATLPTLDSMALKAPARKHVRSAKQATRTFFLERELMELCGRLAARLGMKSDDLLAHAWHTGRDRVRALPSS